LIVKSTIGEIIPFEGFEELIYVCDTSALVNLRINGNISELRRFTDQHPGRIKVPQPIGKEISKKEDDLRYWWDRNKNILSTKFIKQIEHVLHEKIALNYAKRPFPKEGKTYPRVSDEDTYALVIAIARHWTLVTDENAMKAVCRQTEHNTKYIDSKKFTQLIKTPD
jgi:hypothetical protein